jgi:hypothetical protein
MDTKTDARLRGISLLTNKNNSPDIHLDDLAI